MYPVEVHVWARVRVCVCVCVCVCMCFFLIVFIDNMLHYTVILHILVFVY